MSRFLPFALCCSRDEPCGGKRSPKPCLVEATLTTWMDKCPDQMVSPTLSEIRDEAQGMADKRTSVQNRALPCKFGETWWKLFKRRNSAFVSRLPPNVELQRAYARLTPQQWTESFNNHLKAGLEKVACNSYEIWNEDDVGFICQFSTVGQCVWVRKGRKTVARRIAWQQQRITCKYHATHHIDSCC